MPSTRHHSHPMEECIPRLTKDCGLLSTNHISKFLNRYGLFLLVAVTSLSFSVSTLLHFRLPGSLAQFFFSVLGIIPIAALTRHASNTLFSELVCKDHELLAGSLLALLGNSAELCFAITAVVRGNPVVAQTALTGSLISYCLLIFGTSLFFGGILYKQQCYPVLLARIHAQLLIVSLFSFVLPTAYKTWARDGQSDVVDISRKAAIVLLVEFACYMIFHHLTHRDPVDDKSEQGISAALVACGLTPIFIGPHTHTQEKELSGFVAHLGQMLKESVEAQNKESEQKLPRYISIGLLLPALVMMILTSSFVMESIDAPSERWHLSKSFVGLVIMPLMIASIEQVTTALRARKNDLAWIMNLAFGSSLRITLLVFPLIVIIGWIHDTKADLLLDGFQVTVICLTVIKVNYTLHSGLAHWLEGTMFIAAFFVFAIASWHYPNDA